MSKRSSVGTSTPAIRDRERVTEAVVCTVAEEADVSPLELDPIATVVDPDALNRIFEHGAGGVRLEFTYHGYHVGVSGDGRVTVSDGQA